MRVGLIARSESRGLGTQSWEFFRHVLPSKTLLIDMARDAGYETHPEWFPGATVMPWKDELDLSACRKWLDGLDVIYAAETYYDWRFVELARKMGVATVCHVNPEFFKHHSNDDPHPTVWWSATTWRLEHLPVGTRVVPMPVPLDRFPEPAVDVGDPIRWLHVQGRRAVADRNGTDCLFRALKRTRQPHDVLVLTQNPRKAVPVRVKPNVTLRVEKGPEDYWELYEGRDALVLPRRYGGLCLPVLEAVGAGLAVMMTDLEPQRSMWPIEGVKCALGRSIDTPGGMISLGHTNPSVLAHAMDRWAEDPGLVRKAQGESRAFALANSWEAKLPEIMEELRQAVDLSR